MVKGISKQVIVVHAPETKLFEQAIFILREDALQEGITDKKLLQEAKDALRQEQTQPERAGGLLWALAGATLTGILWVISTFF